MPILLATKGSPQEPASGAVVTTPSAPAPPKDTSELIDISVHADDEQRALRLTELVPLPDHHEPDCTGTALAVVWKRIVEEHCHDHQQKSETDEEHTNGDHAKKKQQQQQKDGPNFRRAALAVAFPELIGALIARAVHDALTVGIAFILRGFVEWLNLPDAEAGGSRKWEGFVWAIGLCVGQLVMLGAFAYATLLTLSGLQKIQSSCVHQVYDKTLRLRADVLQQQKGKIVTLHSSESAAIKTAMFLASVFTTLPAIVFMIVSLYLFLDLPGLSAGAVTIVFALVQHKISTKMGTYRRRYLKATDSRLKKTTELVLGIKLCKLMAWEDSFEETINDLRNTEIDKLSSVYMCRSAIIGLSHNLAPVLQVTVFGIVFAVNGTQSATGVFPALLLLNVLRGMMTSFALSVSKFIDVLTSLDRFGAFLQLEERTPYVGFFPSSTSSSVSAPDGHDESISSNTREFAIEMKVPLTMGFHTSSSAASGDGDKKQQQRSNKQEDQEQKQQKKAKKEQNDDDKQKSPVVERAAQQQQQQQQQQEQQQHDNIFVPILSDIQLNIERGKLTAIVGPTASGKSVLLSGFLGEADIDPENLALLTDKKKKNVDTTPTNQNKNEPTTAEGEEEEEAGHKAVRTNSEPTKTGPRLPHLVEIHGTVSSVSQDFWVMNATMRDNILAGKALDVDRYAAAIVHSCLVPDLAAQPAGDQTVVGERGIVVSQGQKARLAIARTIYADRDVNVFDDPLSAVDSHVGESLLHNCFLGALAGRTRVLVTQQWHCLPFCDRVIAMKDQKIVFDGCYDEFAKWKVEAHYHYGGAHHHHHPHQHQHDENDGADASSSSSSSSSSPVDGEKKEMQSNGSSPQSPTAPFAGARAAAAASSSLNDSVDAVAAAIRKAMESGSPYMGEVATTKVDKKITDEAAASSESSPDKQEQKEEQDSTNDKTGTMTKPDGDALRKKGKLATTEKIEHGVVSWRIYLWHFTVGGVWVGVLMHLGFIAWRVSHNIMDFILSMWTSRRGGFGQDSFTNDEYMLWFGVACIITVVAVLWRQICYVTWLTNVSFSVHHQLMRRLIRAPMSFFDTTPTGRIFIRLGKDVEVIDNEVAEQIVFTLSLSYLTLSQVVTMMIGAVYMIPVIALMAVLFHYVRRNYAIALRNVRRLENSARSPVLSVIGETINGLSTIRISGQVKEFTERHSKVLSDLIRCGHSFSLLQGNIGFKVAVIAATITGIMSFIIVLLRIYSDAAAAISMGNGIVALALTYCLALSTSLSYLITMMSQLDATMSSVERVKEYCETLPQERVVKYRDDDDGDGDADGNSSATAAVVSVPMVEKEGAEEGQQQQQQERVCPSLPRGWPAQATISFEGVCMRYRPELPLVLDNLTFAVEAGTRLAIVGRTGSGKSTTTLALFRLVETCAGIIRIGSRDTTTINLPDLRRSISMIPQDPLLFSGTVRSNLDPFNESTDEEVWRAVELVGMRSRLEAEFVGSPVGGFASSGAGVDFAGADASSPADSKSPGSNNFVMRAALNASVTEKGSCFAQGERQLLCLCRSMLKKTKILVLDEATSSVDSSTDARMQALIRSEFVGVTVITIAHRLSTIADYDKVLVMQNGRVGEMDSPKNLLAKSDGIFAGMVDVLGPAEANAIRQIAGKEKY